MSAVSGVPKEVRSQGCFLALVIHDQLELDPGRRVVWKEGSRMPPTRTLFQEGSGRRDGVTL